MPCFRPKRVSRKDGELLWSRPPVWLDPEPGADLVLVPCGACLGCDTAVSRDWALRCFHESLLHTETFSDLELTAQVPNSCVVTLTFDEEHLPKDGALDHEYFQRFMKRVRIWHARRWKRQGRSGPPNEIRYFMCGEYGLLGRPHFHAVLYGVEFGDRYVEQSRDGQLNTMSAELDALWCEPVAPGLPPTKIGRAAIDEFHFAAASYVSGYVAKKSQVPHRGPWLEDVDCQTGEVTIRPYKPEYRKMSTRLPVLPNGTRQDGGLGARWLVENLVEVYEEDSCRLSKWRFRPPKYYDILLERYRLDLFTEVKLRRAEEMPSRAEEWTPERCSAAEAIEIAKLRSRSESLQ